ncbi:MAG: hypothetical protein U0936_17035 [Planctomycetaceae bacterium]
MAHQAELFTNLRPENGVDSGPKEFTDANGILYFSADKGQCELWRKSDGTSTGTILVKDISSGTTQSEPRTAGRTSTGLIHFPAQDNTHGRELWKTDGTAAENHHIRSKIFSAANQVPGQGTR